MENKNIFLNQIREDIELLRKEYGEYNDKLKDEHYAFNCWVLSRLFNIDEDMVDDYIVSSQNKGINCFVEYKDSKDLYILGTNYTDEEAYHRTEIFSDFFNRPLSVLSENKYKKSSELQDIFNKIKDDENYTIHMQFFVTNNNRNKDADVLLLNFNKQKLLLQCAVDANIYYLDNIYDLYTDERFVEHKEFIYKLNKYGKDSILSSYEDKNGVKNDLPISFKYARISVVELFRMYQDAKKINYCLFEENIREWLGVNGVNKKIINTLQDDKEHKNFFYYNNGVTIICDKCDKKSGGVEIKNPQIVNGCQTVNSIAFVLQKGNRDIEDLKDIFGDVCVLLKIYEMHISDKIKRSELYNKIVTYTNSQTAISDKDFAANASIFINLQNEFLNRGTFLIVKPSDETTFKNKYSSTSNKTFQLLETRQNYFDKFGLRATRFTDAKVPLDRLLKVLYVFYEGAYEVSENGKSLMRKNGDDKSLYNAFSRRILKIYSSIDNMLNLWLLYKNSKEEQKNIRSIVPYYVIDFLSRLMEGKNFYEKNDKLKEMFDNTDMLTRVREFLFTSIQDYVSKYYEKYGIEQNNMIKQKMDEDLVRQVLESGLLYSPKIKDFFA